MSTLVLKNAVVIDGTGRDPIVNGSVVLEGERIKEVFRGPAGQLPSDAQINDCRNQTLLPGLIDGHVHWGLSTPTSWSSRGCTTLPCC